MTSVNGISSLFVLLNEINPTTCGRPYASIRFEKEWKYSLAADNLVTPPSL